MVEGKSSLHSANQCCYGPLTKLVNSKKLFPISLELLSNFLRILKFFFNFFQVLLRFFSFTVSIKFPSNILKTIATFFCIPKFHKKLRNTNFYIPVFPHNFYYASIRSLSLRSVFLRHFLISVALSPVAVLGLSNITLGGSEARVVGRNTRRKRDNKE